MAVSLASRRFTNRRFTQSAPVLRQRDTNQQESESASELRAHSVIMAQKIQMHSAHNPISSSSTSSLISQPSSTNRGGTGAHPHQLKRSISNLSRQLGKNSRESRLTPHSYYRPMSRYSRRRARNKTRSACYSDGDAHSDSNKPVLQAWDCFRTHISTISGIDSSMSGSKQSFAVKASDTHRRVIRDLKEKTLRKKARSMILASKLLKSNSNSPVSGNSRANSVMGTHEAVQEEEDTDSEAEMEKEQAEKRKLTAQRHWAIIRREINERIRVRRENNFANKSWNILRHQLKAATHAQTVRRELYAKYGVIKPTSSIQALEKPVLSETVLQLIHNFHALEVKNIKSACH